MGLRLQYMHLCYEVPQLFQENLQNSSLTIELQRLAIRFHDLYNITILLILEWKKMLCMFILLKLVVSTTAMHRKSFFGFKIRSVISQSSTKRLFI